MKVHKLIQGTPEWLAYRRDHFNASDAPAMMGASPYTSRTELMYQLKTGITPDVDPSTQERFDKGHRYEALARPLAEAILEEDLYPQVGSSGKLSASFDGLTACDSIVFEHKTLNAELESVMAPGCVGAELPIQYQIQMEQQLMISGAEEALFMASKWDDDDQLVAMYHCWYLPNLELRKSIVQGWAQFAIDLEAYVPETVEAAPLGRTPETLPALHIEVTGMVTSSNLADYKAHALAVFDSINRDLKTDQDFADAKKAIKWAGDVEDRIEAAKAHALSQTASLDELFRTMDDIKEEARRVRLELNGIVKTRDASIKHEIVTSGQIDLAHHIAECNIRIGANLMPDIPANFAGAIKGMSKFQNMRDAVATELARAKVAANEWADKIMANLKALDDAEDYAFLFNDRPILVLKDPEFVAMTIKTRISDHKAAESAKAATEAANQAAQQQLAKERAEMRMDEPVKATAPADDVPEFLRAPDRAPDLKLGQICTRLGFQVTADFLRSLGFEPAGRERAAVLFHESDFPRICAAIVRHINQVMQGVAA